MNSPQNRVVKKSVTILLYQYVVVLFLAIALHITGRDISNYNGYVTISFAVTFLIYTPKRSVYLLVIGLSAIVAFFSIHNAKLLNIIYDIVLLFYIVSAISLCDSLYFSRKSQTIAINIMFVLILLSVLNIANPLAYLSSESHRYSGIFSGTNTSSNIFAMITIFYWELFKRYSVRRFWCKPILLFVIGSILVYLFVSQTRTLMFVMPYWLYQMFIYFNRKAVIFMSSLVLLTMFSNIMNLLQERMRLTEDSSYLTRAALYQMELEGIKENYFVIPHGHMLSRI